MRISDLKNGTSIGNIYSHKMSDIKNRQKNPNSTKKNSSLTGSANLINDINEIIEKKREQLSELAANENISDELKKMRKEDIEKQIEQLEEQINSVVLEEQKKSAEEQTQNIEKKTDEKKTDIEKFSEMIIFASNSMTSVRKFKLYKAEAKRDAVRVEHELEIDGKNGISSKHKIDELSQLNNTIDEFDKNINKKIKNINEKTEEYSESSVNKKDVPEYEKTEEQKAEEPEKENIKDGETENFVLSDVAERYASNSFERYRENSENKFDEAK